MTTEFSSPSRTRPGSPSHKLWLATDRSPTFATKASKDRQQALTLLAVLDRDRQGDLATAWSALSRSVASSLRVPLGEAAEELGADFTWLS